VQSYPVNQKILLVGVVLLLLLPGVVSSTGPDRVGSRPLIVFTGSVLYVGGGGEGNYSKIQDAITLAHPGDTVYVYDDSSPYYESIVIDKSITLLGENATSTEINGSLLDSSLDTINVTADDVTIRGFHISDNHGYYYQAAVKITADHLNLSSCIIEGNAWIGIYLVGASFCTIDSCELYDNLVALHLINSKRNVIRNCVCHENADAITLFQASNENQLIECVCIRNYFDSILVQQSSGNALTGCLCQDGYDGVSLPYAPGTILRNNSMVNNYANFAIGSSTVSDFYCDIDTSNTINGKPIYYLLNQDNLLFDETTEIGFLGLVHCQNITVRNSDFSHNFEGILLAGTTNSTIETCHFYQNDGHGMYFISCQNNMVNNCSFQDGFWDGIFLFDSSNNTVSNCSYQESLAGLNLDDSWDNMLQGLTIDHCRVGISLDMSGDNTLKNNQMNHCGLQVSGKNPGEYQNDVNVSNTINGRPLYYYVNKTNQTIPTDAGQIILTNCTGCIVSGCNLSNASVGVELAYSSMNTIDNNILNNNSVVAIDLDGSSNNENIICNNVIYGNNYGVDVDFSNMNVFQENLLTDNAMGFSFDSCWKNTVIENTIQDGAYGMLFDVSSDTILTNNIISNSSVSGLSFLSSPNNILNSNMMINCSILLTGAESTEYLNSIHPNNTVNGKPVYYFFGQQRLTIPEDAGEVILVSCRNCKLNHLNLDKGTTGVILAFSSNNIIQANLIKNQSMTGIDLSAPNNDNNIIQGNFLQGNGYGIDLEYSQGNIIRKNRLILNGYGIYLFQTLQTFILRNTISTNYYGLSATRANQSAIFLNNLYQNYVYGLSAEDCKITAPWNWWGAITGPNKGNGDRLHTTDHANITYAPWLRFPVLFTGAIRFQFKNSPVSISVHINQNPLHAIRPEIQQTRSNTLDIFGMRPPDYIQE
jgi:parallel beta-helix repeat protein